MSPHPSGSLPGPCKGGTYAECCGPVHAHAAWPPTAEALMRSRYSAFALSNSEYLLRTWHPRTRPDRLDLDDRTWTGLTITDLVDGSQNDLMGIVEFTATWAAGRERGSQSERSAFVRRAGRWFYLAATPTTE